MTEVEIVIQKQSLQNHKVPYIVPIVNFFPTFKFHYQKLTTSNILYESKLVKFSY